MRFILYHSKIKMASNLEITGHLKILFNARLHQPTNGGLSLMNGCL